MSVIAMAIEHSRRSGAATSCRGLTMSSVAESAETGPPVQTEAKDDEAFVGVVTRSGCQGRRLMRVSAQAIAKANRIRWRSCVGLGRSSGIRRDGRDQTR